MSRRRGRPSRQYRLRVRTVRRDQIDFDALARAALEQAAMNQPQHHVSDIKAPPTKHTRQQQQDTSGSKERGHDRLA